MNCKPTKWDFEAVKSQVAIYKTKNKLRQNCRSAYAAAWRYGWLDRLQFEPAELGRAIKWTFELVQAEAFKYTTLSEFYKGSYNAYQAARRNVWLGKLERLKGVRKTKWTFELVQAEANKYVSKTSFSKGNGAAYKWASRKGHLDNLGLTKQPMGKKLGPTKWTFEKVQAEAVKYKSRADFSNSCRSGYAAAQRNRWLDKLGFAAQPRGRNRLWTLEKVLVEVVKHSTWTAFQKTQEVHMLQL